jgi:hypothetical protein
VRVVPDFKSCAIFRACLHKYSFHLKFEDLSKDEQVTYVEGLLNYMRGVDLAEIPAWHLEILEERLARYRASGVKGRSWKS